MHAVFVWTPQNISIICPSNRQKAIKFVWTSCIIIIVLTLKFSLLVQCYTDDTRLYFHIAPNHTVTARDCLEEGIDAIYQWLSSNRLKLNTDKTEIMWYSSAKQCDSFPELPLSIGNVTVQPTQTVCNLGVQIRSDLPWPTKLAWLYAAASTVFDSCALSTSHCTMKPCSMHPTHSSYPELIVCNSVYIGLPVSVKTFTIPCQ